MQNDKSTANNNGKNNNGKRPSKSILKTSSSFDRPGPSNSGSSNFRKSAKFDELNVLQTYHPPDKDYGHMKIDEPKTPYNYAEPEDNDQLDADLLTQKLRIAAVSQVREEESPDESETPEERMHRLQFEKRRKKHYNEFEAVKLARKLIKEELGEEFESTHSIDDKMRSQNGSDDNIADSNDGEDDDDANADNKPESSNKRMGV